MYKSLSSYIPSKWNSSIFLANFTIHYFRGCFRDESLNLIFLYPCFYLNWWKYRDNVSASALSTTWLLLLDFKIMGSVKLVMCDVMIIDEGDGDSEAMLFSSLVALYWATAHCSTLSSTIFSVAERKIFETRFLWGWEERERGSNIIEVFIYLVSFFLYMNDVGYRLSSNIDNLGKYSPLIKKI